MSDGIMTNRAIPYMRWKLEWEARFLLSNIDKLEAALRRKKVGGEKERKGKAGSSKHQGLRDSQAR